MELEIVPIEKPDDVNLILGQSHFIKTVDDVYEALAGSSPSLRFGLAFCESSGLCLVRRAGNDDELVALAVQNAMAVGAGHSLVVFLRDGFPVNVLNALKQVPEVCRIYCATANPVEVVVARTEQAGRSRRRRWKLAEGCRDGRRRLGAQSASAPARLQGLSDMARIDERGRWRSELAIALIGDTMLGRSVATVLETISEAAESDRDEKPRTPSTGECGCTRRPARARLRQRV